MKNFLYIERDERGSAVLLTLGILSLLMVVAMVFVMNGRNERAVTYANADSGSADSAADSSVARVKATFNYIGKLTPAYDMPADIAPGNLISGFTYAGKHLPYVGNSTPPYMNIGYSTIQKGTAGNPEATSQKVMFTKDSNYTCDTNATIFNAFQLTPFGKAILEDSTGITAADMTFWNLVDKKDVVLPSPGDPVPKITDRYGFIAFSDGGKMDLNSLISVQPKQADYVDEATNAIVDAIPATSPDMKRIIPVMGYTDKTLTTPEFDNTAVSGVAYAINEENTVRYGIHPKELRVKDAYVIIGEQGPIFSYDHLLGKLDYLLNNHDSPLNNPGYLHAKPGKTSEDILRYNLVSGEEDFEVLFNGTAEIAKKNLNDATLWEGLSASAASEKNLLSYLPTQVDTIGINTGGAAAKQVVFKNDTIDVTPQVMANLIDFCDSDDYATCDARLKDNTLINLGTPIGATSFNSLTHKEETFFDPSKWVCGTEKVPYFTGIGLEVGCFSSDNAEDFGKVTNETHTSEPHKNRWTIQKLPKLELKLRAILTNIYPEEFNKPMKMRFVVRGRVCYYYKATYRKQGTTEDKVYYYSQQYGRSYTGLLDFLNNLVHFSVGKGREESLDILLNSTFGYEDFVLEWKDVTLPGGKIDALAVTQDVVMQKEIPLTKMAEVGHQGEGNIDGVGVRLIITDILAMSGDGNRLYDLSYLKVHDNNDLSNETACSFAAEATGQLFKNAIDEKLTVSSDEKFAAARFVVKDPRFNHHPNQWRYVNKNRHYETLDFESPIAMPATQFLGDLPLGESEFLLLPKNDNIPIAVAGAQPGDFERQDGTLDDLMYLSIFTMKDLYGNGSAACSTDHEPEFGLKPIDGSEAKPRPRIGVNVQLAKTISTAFIPNMPISSLWQLGAVHRGGPGQTINLKKWGGDMENHLFTDGDAWLLDYFKLTQVASDKPIKGRFNPNCFNEGAYRMLFSYLPWSNDVNDTDIYLPLAANKDKNIGDQTAATPGQPEYPAAPATPWKLTNYIFINTPPAKTTHQSWSPIQSFYNFVKVKHPTSVADPAFTSINDRAAESFIGCTAGLLSTRYESFTVFVIGQRVKFIMNNGDMPVDAADAEALKNTLPNPVQLGGADGDWYSLLSTQCKLVTLLRDCWENKIHVVSVQKL